MFPNPYRTVLKANFLVEILKKYLTETFASTLLYGTFEYDTGTVGLNMGMIRFFTGTVRQHVR